MEEILNLEIQKQHLKSLLISTKDDVTKDLINSELIDLEYLIYQLKQESLDYNYESYE